MNLEWTCLYYFKEQMKSEFLRIAYKLFERYKEPMSAARLVTLAYKDAMFSDKCSGLTPEQTMKSKLSVHIRRHGEKSPFIRTDPGRFYLRHLLKSGEHIYHAPPLQPPPATERVLVFPMAVLDPKLRFQGLKTHWKRLHRAVLKPKHCRYVDRLTAEQDDQHKQVLTYIVVSRDREILAFQRGTYNRADAFLRGALCVGFGGHVSEADWTLFSASDCGLIESAVRELSEELTLPQADLIRLCDPRFLEPIGVINDDSSPVGRRHFAFLLRYEVSKNSYWNRPRRREKSITQLRWIGKESPIPVQRFEYWSQLVLRELFKDFVSEQPSYAIRRKVPLRPPHVLCLLGPVASGKTDAAKVLKDEYGYQEINSGKILARLLGVRPVSEAGRKAFQELSWQFISSTDGPRLLAHAIMEQIHKTDSDRVLIDGIRQGITLEQLRENLRKNGKSVGLVFVYTPPDIAFRFYNSRQSAPVSIQDFLAIRESPVERETYDMIELADAVLYNWIGRPMYHSTVCEFMGEVN